MPHNTESNHFGQSLADELDNKGLSRAGFVALVNAGRPKGAPQLSKGTLSNYINGRLPNHRCLDDMLRAAGGNADTLLNAYLKQLLETLDRPESHAIVARASAAAADTDKRLLRLPVGIKRVLLQLGERAMGQGHLLELLRSVESLIGPELKTTRKPKRKHANA